MLDDLNNARDMKRQANLDLKLLNNKVETAKKKLSGLTALAEEVNATQTITPEYIGQDKRNLGGKECAERRRKILDRFAKLGPMSPPQRSNFDFFKHCWDTKCTKIHGNEWPKLMLQKLKAVLDEMHYNPEAFSDFVGREIKEVFEGTKALMVPISLKRMLEPSKVDLD